MLTIEIKGQGNNGSLAVLLEYLLMTHGYQVHRGHVYTDGLTEMQRAQILQRMIHNKKTTHEELKEVLLDVVL